MTRKVIVFALATLALDGAPAAGQDQWPTFRGVMAGAVADDPALPDTWSETENVIWKTDIAGLGWSSPVVWDDHIFITAAVSAGTEPLPQRGLYSGRGAPGVQGSSAMHRWIVYDVDFATGSIRWARDVASAAPQMTRHIKNSYASETPVTDGERVYVYFGSIGLATAIDMRGETVWTRELGAHNGPQLYGTAASPVLHDDRLYIVNDNATQSFIAAIDTRTGDEVWRVARGEVENWSTPLVWENEVRTEIVTTGQGKIRSYDLDGHLLWELEGMTLNNVPTPFASNGLVYISSGYPGASPRPVYAIRPGASGDISLNPGDADNDYVVWYQPLLGSYNTSALVYRDAFYTLLDRGFLLSHNARTGAEFYGRQRIEPGSAFTASPWAYNGKVFLLSEDGDTYVVQAGPEFKLLGKNSLNEMSLATPAVLRGSLILRTQSKLYRIAKK